MFKSYTDAGLLVMERGVDPQVAAEFSSEHISYLPVPPVIDGIINGRNRLTGERGPVLSIGFDIGTLLDPERFPVSSRLLGALKDCQLISSETKEIVTINLQAPGGKQDFHQDATSDPVLIIQGGSDGVFDYSVGATTHQEASADYQTIEVNAGDVIIHSKPRMFHRGCNNGDQIRATASITVLNNS